jgi:adenylate kinase
MEAGQLVPDDLVNDLIAEIFRRPDRPQRFILDGYPRTVAQADTLGGLLREVGLEPTAVVLLKVPDEEVVRRISGRRSCAACNANYHVDDNPPATAGICDACGNALSQRKDDRPDTVRARLKEYHRQTAELIPYYRAKGLLHEVNGAGGIDEVYARIVKEIEPPAGRTC